MKKGNKKDIAFLSKQFYELYKVGIDIVKILTIIQSSLKNKTIKESIPKIKFNILSGKSIYEAFNEFPNIYPKFFLNMIRIGEESGKLDNVLKKTYSYYHKQYKYSENIKKALAYPIILTIVMILTTIFLFIKVVPNIINTIMGIGMGIEKSLHIKILIFLSKLFNSIYFYLFIINFNIFIYVFFRKKDKISHIKFKIPYINKLFFKLEEIKFIENLSILVSSGINIYRCFQIMEECTEDKFIKETLYKDLFDIKYGKSISNCLKNNKIFQPSTIAMISIGEETGNLEENLKWTVRILEEDFLCYIEKFLKLIEPIFIFIIAIFIIFISFSLIVPIINLTENLGI